MNPELLKKRKIGSSDAPIIMGVSPWSSKYQLWEQKISGTQSKETWAMKRGTDMEETARRSFEAKMGVSVSPKPVDHPTIKFMTANLDGIDMDEKIMVEIKCPGEKSHSLAKQGKIPDVYYPQLQHQLEVTGLPGMFYYSFDGTDGVILEVAKDAKYIEKLVQEEKEFWKCVLEMEAPELSDKDWIDMDTNEEWRQLSQEWLDIQSNLKSYESKESEIRKKLIELASDKNAKGAGIRLSKSISRGAVDYVNIPQLQGIDLEVYRKKSFTKWRLSGIS